MGLQFDKFTRGAGPASAARASFAAAADRDDADLADLGIDQNGRGGGFHRPSVPCHPQQAAAGQDVGFDIRKGIELGAVTGGFQQRADMRPDFADPFRIGRAPLKRSVSVGGDPSSDSRNLRNRIFQNPQQSNRDRH